MVLLDFQKMHLRLDDGMWQVSSCVIFYLILGSLNGEPKWASVVLDKDLLV